MLIRFVLLQTNPDTGVQSGVFGAAYKLRDRAIISETDQRALVELLDWFENNLKVPGRFNRTKSKGHYRRATKGVSWIKATAEEHIAKFWELAEILKNNGHHVELIKTQRPGYIVYEDNIQVIAEPFSDLRD